MQDNEKVTQELVAHNIQMGEAEKNGESAFFEEVLHDNLRFRRASKAIVSKQEFLNDMKAKKTTYSSLHIPPESVEVTVYEDTAMVSLLLHAAGTKANDGGSPTPWQGIYRNTRIFLNEEGKWQCAFWFNTRIGDLLAD
jgi:hypothetical protein